jgi:Zn-dependent peptidase ImmA (M78 family)/transcriptional regulator with XRE-family HTH domain
MKPGTPLFVGIRLQEAREARGLNVATLADLVDVRRETIYQIESGRITPGPALFEQIQVALRMPAAYFLDRNAESEPDEVLILFRSMSSATKLSRLRAKRRLQWFARITQLVDQYVEVPVLDVPQLDLASDPIAISDECIEAVAESMRTHWALGKGPIANVTWLLENHGVLVAREDLGAETMDAALLYRDGRAHVLLASDKGTDVRSRMDAAHELGHIAVHRHVASPKSDKDPRHKVMEEQAFKFAGAFLLPAESFASDAWSFTLDELVALKKKWRVSVSAMIMRARRLNLISAEHEEKLWKQYGTRRWRKAEPLDDELVPEQPAYLRRALELMLAANVVSTDSILNEIKIPATDIEDLTGLPRGAISDGPVPIAFRGASQKHESTKDNIVPFRVSG